jgi:hypothetical protein
MANPFDTVPLLFDEDHATQTECRAEPRHASGQLAFLRHQPELDATYQLVTIWNASKEGIGLFLSHPMKAGTLCYLQFRHLAVRDRIATVIHAAPKMGGWLVGCKLEEPLRDAELRALRT